MTDIIIYTKADTLKHKQGKLENDDDHSETGDYYWQLSRLPKNTQIGEKIYFATDGYIRGYFIIKAIDYDEGIIFNCNTWKDINPIIITHFQGFKYANKVSFSPSANL